MNLERGVSRIGTTLIMLWTIVFVLGVFLVGIDSLRDSAGSALLVYLVPAGVLWTLTRLIIWIGKGFKSDSSKMD